MGRDPTNFMDSMRDAQKKTSAHGQHSYEQKVLRSLAPLYDYSVHAVRKAYSDWEAEDQLVDFKYEVGDEEFDVIFIKKVKDQKLSQFIYKLDKTEAWKEFCRVHEEFNLMLFGLVFPIKEHGDWIMHNLGMVSVPGVGRIIVPSKKAALRDIIIEPLNFFITGRKET